MEKNRFAIDENKAFEGWHEPSVRWNGFACPFFEREAAEEIARYCLAWGTDCHFDEEEDAFVFVRHGAPEGEDEPFTGQDIATPEGTKHVYAIGAWCWVWTEAEKEEDDTDRQSREARYKWAAGYLDPH